VNTLYKKIFSFAFLGILSVIVLVTCIRHGNSGPSGPPTVIVRDHKNGGFFANISIINHLIHTYEQSEKKLVVLLDSGLYKEDRPQFITDNPYYDKHDWFSYYFEPINQTDQPLSYWKKWVDMSPLSQAMMPEGCSAQIFTVHSIKNYYSFDSDPDYYNQEFHRIWHQYFKLRPHVQKMVDDFKKKHDFANKYVITLHYRGTDKYDRPDAYEDNHEHPPYEFCSALVKKLIRESGHPINSVVTFIATDEQPFVAHMEKEDVNAVFIDAIRSDVNTSGLDLAASGSSQSSIYNRLSTQSIHLGMPDKSNYIKGLDVLVDAILLGSGNTFIKSRGNVSRQACWIGGPKMRSVDLVSEFNAYKKRSVSGDDWKTIYDDL
jgi:hypothetical protein